MAEARPGTGAARFGDPGGPDAGEATSSGASAPKRLRERAAQELNPQMGRIGRRRSGDGFTGRASRSEAPDLRIRRWSDGRWTESPDAVVTEEPLQLMLNGERLSVVMRTPGHDVELAMGLFYAEGIIRKLNDVAYVRISADAAEAAGPLRVDASLVESNTIDVQLAGAVRRTPQRSMLATSACGVCGATVIEDLRRDLAPLAPGPRIDPTLLPPLVDSLRKQQGVFDKTGGLHAAGLFDVHGELLCVREDVGRHNGVDKVVGRLLIDGALPARDSVLVVSGRAGYEIVQKAITAGIPVVAAVGAPSSLAVQLAREFGQTLVGFLRREHFNVYSGAERFAVT